MAHQAGKGSSPRPFSITQEEYATRWDVIFGRDKISKEIEAEQRKHQEETNQEDNKEKIN